MDNDFISLFYNLAVYLVEIVVLVWPIALCIFAWRLARLIGDRWMDKAGDASSRKKRFAKIGDGSTREETLHAISTLTPKEFEYYVADIFTKNGFSPKVVGGHGKGDGGIDIVAKKDSKYYFVQCKKFIGKDIGVSMVRDFYGAIADQIHANGGKGFFITTSYFTDEAKKFAKGKKLTLYDGDDLIDLVYRRAEEGESIGLNGKERSEVMRNIPPICPACRKQLAWRQGIHGTFIGCTGYPACHYVYSHSYIAED